MLPSPHRAGFNGIECLTAKKGIFAISHAIFTSTAQAALVQDFQSGNPL
ncbi:MAG: hypothetical protein HKK66_10175 [Chlorobiaceae bacterium]|nr:hypothetical protein [Chlorobiaceae bacterium]